MSPEQQLLKWFDNVFTCRTRSLADGIGRIDWIDPGTRVSWTEIVSKAQDLGITKNVIELRVWWHEQKGRK